MYTVYKMHRRVNAPVEFKGLKGQYILYAGGSVITAMLLFAVLYIVGVNSYICLAICFGMGALGVGAAHYLSQHYGVHGWRKRRRARAAPKGFKGGSRYLYLQQKK